MCRLYSSPWRGVRQADGPDNSIRADDAPVTNISGTGTRLADKNRDGDGYQKLGLSLICSLMHAVI
jgi:hypothetical protein